MIKYKKLAFSVASGGFVTLVTPKSNIDLFGTFRVHSSLTISPPRSKGPSLKPTHSERFSIEMPRKYEVMASNV